MLSWWSGLLPASLGPAEMHPRPRRPNPDNLDHISIPRFSPYYFIIGGVMDGICGGVSTFSFASFAFIADTSNRYVSDPFLCEVFQVRALFIVRLLLSNCYCYY